MSFDEYHLTTLIQLGLTPNQGKIYLGLLSIGKSTSSVLSKETGLARQEVYRILNELHNVGLVEKILSNPTEFQAIPIREGVSVLMLEKARELDQTKQRMQSLFEEYGTIKEPSPQKDFRFLLVPPKKMVNETRERMLANAKKTVQIITTNRRFSQGVAHFFEAYESALQKNVDIKVIIIQGEKTKYNIAKKQKMLEQYSNFSLRFTSITKPNLLIADNEEAIITLYPTVDLGASPLLWTNHPELLDIFHDYFQTLWNSIEANQP